MPEVKDYLQVINKRLTRIEKRLEEKEQKKIEVPRWVWWVLGVVVGLPFLSGFVRGFLSTAF